MASGDIPTDDPEIKAMAIVVSALNPLPKDAQQRVLRYVSNKFGFSGTLGDLIVASPSTASMQGQGVVQPSASFGDVSPAAAKWMQRSGFTEHDLGALFSIGGEQIDLVANNLPGKSTRSRMRNVGLLMGIASYLSTGAPRIEWEKFREACQHYNAFDGTNFASYLKGFAPEITGSRESGLTLTSRGLVAATALIKSIVKPDSP